MNAEDPNLDELRRQVRELEHLVGLLAVGVTKDVRRTWFGFRKKSFEASKEELDHNLLKHFSQGTKRLLEETCRRELDKFEVELAGQMDEVHRRVSRISAEVHEWLALQTLGLDPELTRLVRFLPLRVYLSSTPSDEVRDVSAVVDNLVQVFGFSVCDEFAAIKGSWFKRWIAKTKDAVAQPEVAKRLEKLERALDLRGLGQPQADIDEKQASAVAKLIASIERVPHAAVQVGSVLLVKNTHSGDASIEVRTLTQKELMCLENNRRLLESPVNLLKNLSSLSAATLPHESSAEAGQLPGTK